MSTKRSAMTDHRDPTDNTTARSDPHVAATHNSQQTLTQLTVPRLSDATTLVQQGASRSATELSLPTTVRSPVWASLSSAQRTPLTDPYRTATHFHPTTQDGEENPDAISGTEVRVHESRPVTDTSSTQQPASAQPLRRVQPIEGIRTTFVMDAVKPFADSGPKGD